MSRDRLTRADMDVDFYSDPKIVALARRLRDPVKTAAWAALYDATVRASWREGRRLTLEESLPAWWLDPPDALADLVAVGLLDDEGRVSERAWASWYLPAAERVEDARFAGMVGGLMKSLGISKEEATAIARERSARSDLSDPQVPPSPTDQPAYLPTGPASDGSNPAAPQSSDGDTSDDDPVAGDGPAPSRRRSGHARQRQDRDEWLKLHGQIRAEPTNGAMADRELRALAPGPDSVLHDEVEP